MTSRDEILQTPPGRALDALVAEHVMGYEWGYYPATPELCFLFGPHENIRPVKWGRRGKEDLSGIPRFSESIEAAFEVVEKMRADGWLVVIKAMPPRHGFVLEGSRSEYDAPAPDRTVLVGKTVVELSWMSIETPEDIRRRLWCSPMASAAHAPEAICKAALRAVLEQKNEAQ